MFFFLSPFSPTQLSSLYPGLFISPSLLIQPNILCFSTCNSPELELIVSQTLRIRALALEKGSPLPSTPCSLKRPVQLITVQSNNRPSTLFIFRLIQSPDPATTRVRNDTVCHSGRPDVPLSDGFPPGLKNPIQTFPARNPGVTFPWRLTIVRHMMLERNGGVRPCHFSLINVSFFLFAMVQFANCNPRDASGLLFFGSPAPICVTAWYPHFFVHTGDSRVVRKRSAPPSWSCR